jgi:hypothetical protein
MLRPGQQGLKLSPEQLMVIFNVSDNFGEFIHLIYAHVVSLCPGRFSEPLWALHSFDLGGFSKPTNRNQEKRPEPPTNPRAMSKNVYLSLHVLASSVPGSRDIMGEWVAGAMAGFLPPAIEIGGHADVINGTYAEGFEQRLTKS